MANSVDPDQCSSRSSLSGSALFAYVILSDTLEYEILGHLLKILFHFSEKIRLSYEEFS